MVGTTLQLDHETLQRANRMMGPWLDRKVRAANPHVAPETLGGVQSVRVSRSEILRVAIDRGLAALELELAQEAA